jgi:hypothetical protein
VRSLAPILRELPLPVVQNAVHEAASPPPLLVGRSDDPHALLLAAKALVFCGFPYKRSPLTTITREAQLGSDTHLTVYFSTTGSQRASGMARRVAERRP